MCQSVLSVVISAMSTLTLLQHKMSVLNLVVNFLSSACQPV
jgi:hypothetical protein